MNKWPIYKYDVREESEFRVGDENNEIHEQRPRRLAGPKDFHRLYRPGALPRRGIKERDDGRHWGRRRELNLPGYATRAERNGKIYDIGIRGVRVISDVKSHRDAKATHPRNFQNHVKIWIGNIDRFDVKGHGPVMNVQVGRAKNNPLAAQDLTCQDLGHGR